MAFKFILIRVITILSLFSSIPIVAAQDKIQMIAGAGPSTKVATLFAKKFGALLDNSEYKFFVPEKSIKHKGGIQASSRYLFGRTGRPLHKRERAMNKDEIILARIPIVFVTGRESGISSLTIQEIQEIFTGKISNWQEVGGNDIDIVVVGREPTEAIYSVIKSQSPIFGRARFSRVYQRDHQVVRFLKSPAGGNAVAFGAQTNFNEINLIDVEGFSEGVEVGLVYDLKNSDHDLVKSAKRYAASKEWADAVKQIGLLPPR